MPLGPSLIRIFNIDPAQFGFLVSSYTFSAGASSLLGVFFLDRFSRRKALLFVYVGHTLATLACGLAPSYSSLLGARIVAGAFGGLTGTLIFSFIADCFEFKRRGSATGIVMSAFSLASVVGIPFGLFLANWFEWHAPFFLLGILGTLILVGTYFKLPAATAEEDNKETALQSFLYVITRLEHWKAFALTCLLMFAGFTVIPYISPSLVANTGLLESQLPLVYLFGGAATFFSSPWFGRLSDRFGPHRVFSILALISIFPILLVTQLNHTPIVFILIITTSFMVFVGGRFVPAMALVLSSVNPRYRASFMSLNTAIQQLAAGLASLLSANVIVANAGRLEKYEVVGYVAVAATLMALWILPKVKAYSA